MLRSGISVLLLVVAVTYAAPRAFPVHQVERQDPNPNGVGFWPSDDEAFRYGEPEEGTEDQYPDVVYESKPFEGAVDVDFNLNPDNAPVLANGTVTNVIFRDLEHRIAEDVQRMQQDMLLFRRLFGLHLAAPRFPPSLLLPWGSTTLDDSDETEDSGPVGFDANLFGHDDSDNGNRDGDNDDDDDDDFGIFGGFPLLGIDRPLFSGFPELPGVGFINPADLPGNYSNETSVVQSIDGGQVQVNNTINKESGNDFNAFFHHQVIHFRPDEEEGKVPEEGASTSAPGVPATEAPEVPLTAAPEAPVTEDSSNKDEVTTSAPQGEDNDVPVSVKPPAIPEVIPEFSANTRAESFDVAKENSLTEEEDFEIANNLLALDASRKAERSLRLFDALVFPNDSPRQNRFPESAHYHAHKDQEGHDAEVVTDGSAGKRPADLSKDTRVNYISHGSGGMAKPDPDAEIFNYGLVMEEERAARRHG